MVSNKVVIGLSGGMDSAALLGHYVQQGYRVHCCSFIYGSKHNDYELQSAENIVSYYNDQPDLDEQVVHHVIDIRTIFQHADSSLMKSGEDIPEGHFNSESMQSTIVPGRNLIFASIMASIAESVGASKIGLGVHSGDHHIYPDCRPEFINSLSNTIHESTDWQVLVEAPFQNMNKADILKYGYSMNTKVPFSKTRTCYKTQPISCGKCGSCRERLEAFESIGMIDPIEYEHTRDSE